MEARKALVKKAQAQVEQQQVPADRAGLYSAWATADPSLDDRLDEYLQSDFEPDRSRNWMLRE